MCAKDTHHTLYPSILSGAESKWDGHCRIDLVGITFRGLLEINI